MGPSFQFYRKYSADIKYHNPHLKMERIKTKEGPMKVQFNVQKGDEKISIDPTEYENVEALKEKLITLGNKVM